MLDRMNPNSDNNSKEELIFDQLSQLPVGRVNGFIVAIFSNELSIDRRKTISLLARNCEEKGATAENELAINLEFAKGKIGPEFFSKLEAELKNFLMSGQ